MAVSPVQLSDISQVVEKSRAFNEKNPFGSRTTTTSAFIERGETEEKLLENANSAYPIVHYRVWDLMGHFLALKKAEGTEVEKEVYRDMDTVQFLERLLLKRALVFVGKSDAYMLRDRVKEGVAFDTWHKVGTPEEEEPIIMRDYLTYHEAKLAALIGASTKTFTVNKGDRRNAGVVAAPGSYQPEGIIVGLVGPRMTKDHAVEREELVVTEEQNSEDKEYGARNKGPNRMQRKLLQLFGNFYSIPHLPTFEEVCVSMREEKGNKNLLKKVSKVFKKEPEPAEWISKSYVEITGSKTECVRKYLHIPGYNLRNQITAEMHLAEASSRAGQLGKSAYVHVVGLGLGVWRIYEGQNQLFANTYATVCSRLKLPNISHLDLSWIQVQFVEVAGIKVVSGETLPGTGTILQISNRDPWQIVDQGQVIVASWAWDGMSLVGNEYWGGGLTSSSDPAAACSTQIPELLNPYINPVFQAANVRIVGEDGSLSLHK